MDNQSDLLIIDYAKELAELLDQGDEQDNLFERGRKFGLAQAASLLVQEAKAFEADLDRLGLKILLNRPDLP